MNDPLLPPSDLPVNGDTDDTLTSSMMSRLITEVIKLRESVNRNSTNLEKNQNRTRTELQTSFNSFAADTQRAYQQLRQEIQGEKKFSMALLTALLELGQELGHLMDRRPAVSDSAEKVDGWIEAIGVQTRKVQAILKQHGIVEYQVQPGEPYNPALHERVGSERVEGLPPLMVGRQTEPGFASQLPDFKLVRAKVIVSE
jgi:molecular chaperone GrpE (heat shock protein)